MKMEMTKTQLAAIVTACDNLSAMRGGMDEDTEREFTWIVKNIDRFLKKNGIKRKLS